MTRRRPLSRALALFFSLLFVLTTLTPAAFAIEDPNIQATAAILADPESGMILYEKNAREKRYPASTTKVMTALVVLENIKDLEATVEVLEEDFENLEPGASSSGFKAGEVVRVIDLLYGLMLPSGNEAANILARYTGTSIETFVNMMNSRAKSLGCTGTHFVNPNGLHNEEHYTTAYDLYLIAREAMKNETFADIVSTAQKTLPATNLQEARKIYTTNMMIFNRSYDSYYAYCEGIKTGYTSAAGYCLVSAAERKGGELMSVLLGCERGEKKYYSSFYETRRLFEWGYDNFTYKTLLEEKEQVQSVPVRLSTQSDAVVAIARNEVAATVPIDVAPEDMERVIEVPEIVDAPIKAGDKLGTITLQYNGVTYGETDLVALNDVTMSEVLYYADKLENFFRSPFFRVGLLVLVVLLILYIFAYVVRARNLRARRTRRSQQRRLAQYDREDTERRRTENSATPNVRRPEDRERRR
ncbi:MAG: D-alanyl-D-alanine carboxypeptidase [Butyricicoccus sp.]|nr:D-alanyl-D-alanine carboxypeptidase [Butyricicoccus sp.]